MSSFLNRKFIRKPQESKSKLTLRVSYYCAITLKCEPFINHTYMQARARIKKVSSGGRDAPENLFYWSSIYFTGGRKDLHRDAIVPKGSNCFSNGRSYMHQYFQGIINQLVIVRGREALKGDPYPSSPLDPPMRQVLTRFSR